MQKSTKIRIWAWAMRTGNRMGCHQREDRSFKMKEWQFPICSRCTGILTGQLLGLVWYLCGKTVPYYLVILFLAVMFLDWWIQYKGIKESNNTRRFITGNLAGIGQMSILIECILWIGSVIG